ncbi:hypothetical protein [Lutispora sp.]
MSRQAFNYKLDKFNLK